MEQMISGVVVACLRQNLGSVRDAVERLPWAAVHYEDPSGRLVVTVEASGIEESFERFKVLQGLPDVLSASLAEYRLEGDEGRNDAHTKRGREDWRGR
jgi:nitrate reductase NapAB chaperone NapD